MGRRRRTGDREPEGGLSRWLLTYADLITLLMAFFIMLYSMSIINLGRFHQVAVSIKSGLGGIMDGRGASPLTGRDTLIPAAGDSIGVPWRVVRRVQNTILEKKLDKEVRLRADERGFVISLVANNLAFDRGQADLLPDAKRILNLLGSTLKEVPNQIRVEGHTCDLPTHSSRYPSNWELSSARACSVARYLIDVVHIPPERIAPCGFAQYRPVLPNRDEKSRAINRRVDIVLLKTN